jgi:FMN phosphatase YigB (HAD superfamily)
MIKNILFDLGGVLLNLDQNKTISAFENLGIELEQVNLHAGLFTDFETGKCNADFFIASLKQHLPTAVDSSTLVNAWNAMLLDFPAFRIELLKELQKDYQLFLFSNTNSIHIEAVLNLTDEQFGKGVFESMFNGVYYSHEIGLRKPDVIAFEKVLELAKINAAETIFIDDSPTNISGAQAAGLHTVLAKHAIETNFVSIIKEFASRV